MSYRRLIKSWHLKASEEDYFSKFMFEYLAFIAYVNTELSQWTRNDRKSIQVLKRNNDIKIQYLEKLNNQNSLKSSWRRIKMELENAPLGITSRHHVEIEEIKWWNCSHNESNQKTHEENNKLTGVIHSLSDWENMVEFWYSIRNNLFHGTKDPEVKRDRLLVKHGYKTLRPLVERFLENLNKR